MTGEYKDAKDKEKVAETAIFVVTSSREWKIPYESRINETWKAVEKEDEEAIFIYLLIRRQVDNTRRFIALRIPA